jgi:hypothetical protein
VILILPLALPRRTRGTPNNFGLLFFHPLFGRIHYCNLIQFIGGKEARPKGIAFRTHVLFELRSGDDDFSLRSLKSFVRLAA